MIVERTLLALRTEQNRQLSQLVVQLLNENAALAEELHAANDKLTKEIDAHGKSQLACATTLKQVAETSTKIDFTVEEFVKAWWEEWRMTAPATAADPEIKSPDFAWDALWSISRQSLTALAKRILN